MEVLKTFKIFQDVEKIDSEDAKIIAPIQLLMYCELNIHIAYLFY